jgi:Holliday junction resolvase-like predicted endonuclease
MTNYTHGHDAEKYAAQWLQEQDYSIIALSWRDRRAEIDIISGASRNRCALSK